MLLVILFLFLGALSLFFLQLLLKKQRKKIYLRIELRKSALKKLEDEKSLFQKVFSDSEDKIKRLEVLFDEMNELSAFLEESKLLQSAKESLSKFCSFSHIEFVDSGRPIPEDYSLFPLDTKNGPYRYVAFKGLKIQEPYFLDVFLKHLSSCLKRAHLYRFVEEMSIHDYLTGCFSRRHLLERLEDEFSRAKRFSLKLSLMILDIDNFKSCNDTYGHLVGDAVLKEVVEGIQSHIRSIDFVGRFGGEEFLIVLPETEQHDAFKVGSRILEYLRQHQIKAYDETLKVTASIGLATYPEDAENLLSLIEASDQALYKAKREGKDRICFLNEGKNRLGYQNHQPQP